jgi:TrwC relaxase
VTAAYLTMPSDGHRQLTLDGSRPVGCADGMRGHRGDGQSAATVAGSGLLGWSMVHRAARPAAGRPVGDPHWPVHVTLANMTRGADGRWSTVAGRWSTVAADERDLMRPAPAVDCTTATG